jgi:hypothetical protein
VTQSIHIVIIITFTADGTGIGGIAVIGTGGRRYNALFLALDMATQIRHNVIVIAQTTDGAGIGGVAVIDTGGRCYLALFVVMFTHGENTVAIGISFAIAHAGRKHNFIAKQDLKGALIRIPTLHPVEFIFLLRIINIRPGGSKTIIDGSGSHHLTVRIDLNGIFSPAVTVCVIHPDGDDILGIIAASRADTVITEAVTQRIFIVSLIAFATPAALVDSVAPLGAGGIHDLNHSHGIAMIALRVEHVTIDVFGAISSRCSEHHLAVDQNLKGTFS